MADLRIVDAPVLLQESITDDVKMPTGGLGNFSVRLGDILWYVITKEQLANKNYVDLSSKGVQDNLDSHISDNTNPHEVTKAQVGLGNVDNTADIDKPVSNAVRSAIITATTDMATKAYVNQQDNLKADKATTLSGYGITDAYTKDETLSKIEIDNALTLKADVVYVDGKDGDLTTLKTADKTNLVKAINEVYDDTKGVVALYDKNVEAAAAGAGANGWTDLLIDAQGLNQRQINNGLTDINELTAITNPQDKQKVFVSGKQRSTFIYDSTKSSVNDGVMVLNGWVRTDVKELTLAMANINIADSDNSAKLQKLFDAAGTYKIAINGEFQTIKVSNVKTPSYLTVKNLNLEASKFDVEESVLTTGYGTIDFLKNIKLINVNIDGKRELHTGVSTNRDGNRSAYLIQQPIDGLEIINSKFKNAVTDGLLILPIDWITPSWDYRAKNIKLTDFTSVGNGRHGVSSDSTYKIICTRCNFNNNGFDLQNDAQYTTGLSARKTGGKIYGCGLDIEEYEGRADSSFISLIDCDMTKNAGVGCALVRTGYLINTAKNITISGGKYDYGVENSANDKKASIAVTVYSATGLLDAYNVTIDNVDLGGGNLLIERSQKANISNIKSLDKVLIDQSIVTADTGYAYQMLNVSYSNFINGITENTIPYLGLSNRESTVILHTENRLGAVSKFSILGNGAQIGGIWFEKAQPANNNGINFHFKNGNGTILSVMQYGSIIPKDNAADIGHASFRFKNIYAVNGVIQTSDANSKTDIIDILEVEKQVALELKSLIKRFKYVGGDRLHFGVIAQEVEAVFTKHGLNVFEYGLLCLDDISDTETRYGVRYNELAMFILASI